MKPVRLTKEERKAEREARRAQHVAYRQMTPEERRAARLAAREAHFAEWQQRHPNANT